MIVETITLNAERNVTLTAYIQDVGGEFLSVTKRPAVLVLPGGGYEYCSDREADPVALSYAKAGYQTFVLRYSIGEHAIWPNPLIDYEQAMELIQSNADKWHVVENKIAVIGFSAGGHLACAAATMSKYRPAAAILGYAVAGTDVKGCNPSAPDTISQVDKNTPPCFIFATRTDNVVPVNNSLRFMQALNDAGISFESHIYAYGPHGYSTGVLSLQKMDHDFMCSRVPNWVADSIGWLEDVLGIFGPEGFVEPICPGHVNDDYKDFLSIDCTIGTIMKNPSAMELLKPMIDHAKKQLPESMSFSDEAITGMLSGMKLTDAMDFVQVTDEMKAQLNTALNQIPNNA